VTAGNAISGPALSGFRDRFSGQIVGPDDPDYDQARIVWNAMADRRPALVVRPEGPDDVVAAVRFAREQDLLVAVRGGGHSVAGFSTCDGGIVIDLSRMRGLTVIPEQRIARAEGGAHLSQLDKEAQAFGLACPVGVVGHTGVAGLTLGGGMGRLQRKFGFTIDNLLSVDLVTADGSRLRASADENADLFWGIRGAGPNFGVVTSFEFRLHPLDSTITYGWIAFPIERSREVGGLIRDFMATASDDAWLSVGFGLATDPPFRADLSGMPVIVVSAAHCGRPADAERDLRPLRTGLDPLMDTFAPRSYVAVQGMNDDAMAWGKRFYMKGALLAELSDEAMATCAAQLQRVPSGGDCSISLWAFGGAIGQVADDAMAFTGRTASWWIGFEAAWEGAALDEPHKAWSRRAVAALKPFTTVGQYVNDAVESDVGSVRAIYGADKYERLVGLKRLYDPDNFFRLNANIRP
jgi:FAD/FMN-containing dehydrogenase